MPWNLVFYFLLVTAVCLNSCFDVGASTQLTIDAALSCDKGNPSSCFRSDEQTARTDQRTRDTSQHRLRTTKLRFNEYARSFTGRSTFAASLVSADRTGLVPTESSSSTSTAVSTAARAAESPPVSDTAAADTHAQELVVANSRGDQIASIVPADSEPAAADPHLQGPIGGHDVHSAASAVATVADKDASMLMNTATDSRTANSDGDIDARAAHTVLDPHQQSFPVEFNSAITPSLDANSIDWRLITAAAVTFIVTLFVGWSVQKVLMWQECSSNQQLDPKSLAPGLQQQREQTRQQKQNQQQRDGWQAQQPRGTPACVRVVPAAGVENASSLVAESRCGGVTAAHSCHAEAATRGQQQPPLSSQHQHQSARQHAHSGIHHPVLPDREMLKVSSSQRSLRSRNRQGLSGKVFPCSTGTSIDYSNGVASSGRNPTLAGSAVLTDVNGVTIAVQSSGAVCHVPDDVESTADSTRTSVAIKTSAVRVASGAGSKHEKSCGNTANVGEDGPTVVAMRAHRRTSSSTSSCSGNSRSTRTSTSPSAAVAATVVVVKAWELIASERVDDASKGQSSSGGSNPCASNSSRPEPPASPRGLDVAEVITPTGSSCTMSGTDAITQTALVGMGTENIELPAAPAVLLQQPQASSKDLTDVPQSPSQGGFPPLQFLGLAQLSQEAYMRHQLLQLQQQQYQQQQQLMLLQQLIVQQQAQLQHPLGSRMSAAGGYGAAQLVPPLWPASLSGGPYCSDMGALVTGRAHGEQRHPLQLEVQYSGGGGAMLSCGHGSGELATASSSNVQNTVLLQKFVDGIDNLNMHVKENTALLAENARVQQELHSGMRELSGGLWTAAKMVRAWNLGKEMDEQRGMITAAMQRGMMLMWASVLVAAVKWGRWRTVVGICSQPPDGPNFVAPAAPSYGLRSLGWWSMRAVRWTLGLSGWATSSSSGNTSFLAAALQFLQSCLQWMLSLEWPRKAACYGSELGMQGFCLLALWYLLRPLLRTTLSLDLRNSWIIDVPLLLGVMWGVVGASMIGAIGGRWTVWLMGWWLWCIAGFVMHAWKLRRMWAQFAMGTVLMLLPVLVGLLPFMDRLAPAHAVMEGLLEELLFATAQWVGREGMGAGAREGVDG